MLTAISNASYYGGGFCPAPDAVVNDGLLDVAEVGKVSRPKMLSLLKKYQKGMLANTKYCSITRCKKVTIESDQELVMNFDGETVRLKDGRADFENLHNAITLWLPSSLAQNPDFQSKYGGNCEQIVKIAKST